MPIHSGIQAGGSAKTGIDVFDHMLFASTSSMCPSPETVGADAKTFNSRNHITIFWSMTTKRKKF